MNERDILQRLKKGDRTAFNALFARYAAKLYNFSLRYFQNDADAQEIVQETFLRIWETRCDIDEARNFESYIISIARNRIYNLFRRRAVERKYLDSFVDGESADYPVSPEADNITKKIVHQGIGHLPRQQREVLMLKIQGMDNSRIADSLNISKRTVETHVRRSYKFLREYLARNAGSVFSLLLAADMTIFS